MNFAPEVKPIVFDCAGDAVAGMLHRPPVQSPSAPHSDLGVVIVVGGPQTRVGSHRQFVKLAQALADAGVVTLRFDTRGMGDSHGAFPGFAALGSDINAAVSALLSSAPQVQRVVLWGLCDGASAILIESAKFAPQVCGAVLVNPWVHDPEAGGAAQAVAAKIQVKHYYAKRLMSGEFWKKLFSGKLNPLKSGGEFLSTAKKTRQSDDAGNSAANAQSFVDQMRVGWTQFVSPILVITAGDDLVAQEWLACSRAPAWTAARQHPVATQHLAQANHTFSSAQWRKQVEDWTLAWVRELPR